MEKFIVSARKYRPQLFDTVVGQSHITTTLKNAIKSNQLAHAFLFCGPRGVGKTTCARILAKTINCENKTPEGEACNTCPSCVSFNEGISLNIHELDAASNNSVDDIRTLVEQVRFAPQAGKYKVYIIDEVHMLSSSAFNAFLKTLEEPPSYAIFILATTEKHKILPTILSRCQIFDFKRITTQDTVEHLQGICQKEQIKAEKSALQVISQKSEGCLRDALSILDKIVSFTNGELSYLNTLEHLNILDEDYYFKLLQHIKDQDLPSMLLLYDTINQKGFEGDLVLNGFAEFIRNVLVCKDPASAGLLEAVESFRDKFLEVALQADNALLLSSLNVLNDAELTYKQARNKKLHVELTLIKLCYLSQAIELSTQANGLVKKKRIDGPRSLAFRNIVPLRPFTPSPTPIEKPPTDTPVIKGEKLYIETPQQAKPVINPPAIPVTSTTAAIGKIGALDKIRSQYQQSSMQQSHASELPELEKILEAWASFTLKLKKARNPGAQSFELATLSIEPPYTIVVTTANNIEQKFIEHDKNMLYTHLQKKLNIKQLQITVKVTEQGLQQQADIPPSERERLATMVTKYPMIRMLIEKLHLDLD